MKLEGKKILLVEDDNFIGDMFTRKLKSEGALCTRANNGTDGLAKLKENNYDFDVIVTDIMMSKMDGYEMVKEIKKDEQGRLLPVIVVTNRNSSTPETARITELDIDGMYIKSSTPLHEIVQHIVDAIEKRGGAQYTQAT
jgi:CheY-like chemotaxis protein